MPHPYGWAYNHCYRKVAYLSWQDAEAAALRIMDEAPDGRSLHAYACELNPRSRPFNPHWHVGHDVAYRRSQAMAATKVRA